MSKLEFNVDYTVSIYPSIDMMRKMGYEDMFTMSEDLESMVKINYPGLIEDGYCMFDPEYQGFMVYCTGKDVQETIENEFKELMNSCGL